MGTLFVVGTPIGNLEDITYRAIRTLKEVDLIICEDTRHSRILFNKYDIKTEFTSYHQHSRIIKLEYILDRLKSGENVAMISDAGTPGICDPGESLIIEAVKEDIKIVPIPGPSAVISLLSVSGFCTDSFLFLGFLPKKKGRMTLLNKLKKIEKEKIYETVIIYVSPYQTIKTIKDLYTYLGERQVVVGRELTKKFEEVYRGGLKEAGRYFEANAPRGEFVVCVKMVK